jgi:proteasome activator subunit 4
LAFIKIRTYSRCPEELWLDEWRNPLQQQLPIDNAATFLQSLDRPVNDQSSRFYVDKISTGFLSWTNSIKSYETVGHGTSPIIWEAESLPCLKALHEVMSELDYFGKLALLWGQESNRNGGTTELRGDNVTFIKSLGKSTVAKLLPN